MPLQELVINGFKSFADKTTIKFDSGITGIVGPNGSGKSNITEAIRWVMGESSAKSLRGENMKDVIFAGSQFRTPMNHAEVTLIFDNSNHEMNFDDTNVAITRKILRNGDSQYLINNQQVRLRDLRALFVDAGMSQDSLAIISQGKVDQILNSRPQERRSIFDEAAGVLHFKEQKQAALRQLEKTNDNLIRINDLVKELADRVEPLAQQSSLAKEYKFQKKQLDAKIKQLLAIQLYQLNKQKKELEESSSKNERILLKLDNEVKKSQTDLEEKRNQSNSLTLQKDQLQKAVLDLTQEIARLNTEMQMQEQTHKYDAATRKEYVAQKEELLKSQESLEEQLKVNEANYQKNKATLNDLKSRLHQLNTRLQESPDELNQCLENMRNDYIQTLQDQANVNNRISYIQKEVSRIQNTSNVDELQLESELKQATNRLEDLKNEGNKLEKNREALESRLEILNTEIQKNSNSNKQVKNLIDQIISLLNKQTAQVEGLQRLKDSHEGYYYGVKYVLNHLNDFDGVIGVVGELISFPENLEAALTTALAGGVQNLVTTDRNSARNAIYELKKKGSGRATFLPLDGLRHNSIPSSTITTLKSIDGYLGIANQLVTSKAQVDINSAIDYLLGNVIIVDNMDTALQVQRRAGKYYRIVTLDGDIISPGGSMTGGARNQRNNSPLATNSQIEKLNKAISKEKEELENYKQQYQVSSQKLTEQQNAKSDLQDNLQKVARELGQCQLSYQSQEKEVKRLKHLHQLQEVAKKEKVNELADLNKQLQDQQDKKSQLAENAKKQKVSMEQIKLDLADLDNTYTEVQSQISELRSQIAVSKNNLENISNLKKQNQERLAEIKQQINNLSKKIIDLDPDKNSNKISTEEIKKNISEIDVNKNKRQAELNKISEQLGKLDAQIANLDSIASRNYDLRKDAAQEQEKLSAQKAQISEKMNHNLKQLSEDYALTYEAALKLTDGKYDDEALAKLQKEVRLHKMSIADIGPVNLKSIEEYEEVKGRYDFLNGQQNDLLKARTDIENSMSKLDGEVESRFGDTFKKIAKSFSDIFPIMFGGGSAQLVLTEPDNLLETGIEIIAQPPGKKLQKLSLLSGGERALTAITLLFAMLQVNPVPFCILDEVEAALDEANVARFAQFLNHYDFSTQFIVITHRRGTMQKSDNLYGVVMQESGVSQVLSVSLKELKKEVN